MKGAIIFSTKNPASLNIMRHLQKEWNWDKKSESLYVFSACGKENCCTAFQAVGIEKEIIQIEPPGNLDADYFIYASTHKSQAHIQALTAHIPGNWGPAEFGGQPNTLNVAYAAKLKQILQLLDEAAKKRKLGWQVNLEADHHGPTPNGGKHALIFVEIGSGPQEWENETAGSAVAEAIMKSLVRPASEAKTYIGIGGGHYAPKFTSIMLDSPSKAVGHVLPKYNSSSFDEKMLKQAVEKTVEKVQGALIDWKGLGKDERDRIISILEKSNMPWERA
jgi:D-aminoacyl-tRNA deacylase